MTDAELIEALEDMQAEAYMKKKLFVLHTVRKVRNRLGELLRENSKLRHAAWPIEKVEMRMKEKPNELTDTVEVDDVVVDLLQAASEGSNYVYRASQSAVTLIRKQQETIQSLREQLEARERPFRVKGLEWQEPKKTNNYCYIAKTPIGDYYVDICGGRHQAMFDLGGHDMIGDDDMLGEPSGHLETEQIKCQEHFDKLIGSMLPRAALAKGEG